MDESLTPHQLNLARLVTEGYINKEIACLLDIKYGTIKNQISDILKKLKLPNRTALAVWYLKNQGGEHGEN
jgi:DNA-binding NarL/FixJ family response regulator